MRKDQCKSSEQEKIMASNKTLVPEAKAALDKFKMVKVFSENGTEFGGRTMGVM